MKLRQLPDDFQVDELSMVRPGRGRDAFYSLQKRSISTLEAVQAIARRLKIPRAQIAFGGLKDSQAVTSQHLTIEHGPARAVREERFQLKYLGQLDRPFHASDIDANRFRLVVRDVDADCRPQVPMATAAIQTQGLANYFDDQRFWSLGESRQFIALPWIRRQYEQACRLALTDPLDSDRPTDRRERTLIASQWGHWRQLVSRLAATDRRAMIEHLAAQPTDFRRALTRIAHDQRSIYLAAFQSFLWNELVAEWLRRSCPGDQLVSVPLRAGVIELYRTLEDSQFRQLSSTLLPLPAARLAPENAAIAELLEQVLAQNGLQRREIKLDYPRDTFFSKGERPAIVLPRYLQAQVEDDDLQPGRLKITLAFELPRGSYATMLVKRLALFL